MWMHLVYLKLELKRACKRLPHLYAGAIILLAMAGVIALLSSRMLYDGQVVGRVAVGVSVPKEDTLARQVVKMISSLESVGSVCDFKYMDRASCMEELQKGNLYGVLDVPEGFVQDIMNGTNTPVAVWFGPHAGVEGRLFQELTDAGALTLSASQAGIYAGNELYQILGFSEDVGQMEWDLNKRYMDYSLQRTGYFRHLKVQATGDISPMEFYGISAYVLFLFLTAIPVSGYLMPSGKVMRQKLTLAGIGGGYRAAVKIAGMGLLMAAATLPLGLAAVWGRMVKGSLILVVVWILSCSAAAGMVVFLYQLAGTFLGGMMLLFFTVTGQHFLAGGFLPFVFLPKTIQKAAPYFPSSILMDSLKMAVSMEWNWRKLEACAGLLGATWLLCTAAEVRRR